MEMVDPFGWHVLDEGTLRQVHSKLSDFERSTWNDIFVKGRHHHHSVPVARFCAEARRRLQALRLDDLDELHRLRLMGKQRVWGIFAEGIFTLLWWDPEHLVCPWQPPNT